MYVSSAQLKHEGATLSIEFSYCSIAGRCRIRLSEFLVRQLKELGMLGSRLTIIIILLWLDNKVAVRRLHQSGACNLRLFTSTTRIMNLTATES
jgi:hypothetical protein